ncbi:site-specific integrase, partial [Mycobacterium kansasii]
QMATRGERIAIQQPWDAHPESLRDLFPDEAWSLYQATGLNETKNSVALSCYRATLARPIDLVPYRVLLMAGTGVAVE